MLGKKKFIFPCEVSDPTQIVKNNFGELALSNVVCRAFAQEGKKGLPIDADPQGERAKRRKVEQGDWVSGFTPFGYVKDPQIINHLIAGSESSKTVRRIFIMASSGMGTHEITVPEMQRMCQHR